MNVIQRALGEDPEIEKFVLDLEKNAPLFQEHIQNHQWMQAWRVHSEICRGVTRIRLECGRLYLLSLRHVARVKRALRITLDAASALQEGERENDHDQRFLPYLRHFRKKMRKWANDMISHTLKAAAEAH